MGLNPFLQLAIVSGIAIFLPYLLGLMFERIDKKFAYLGLA
jgi:hypothetical protein